MHSCTLRERVPSIIAVIGQQHVRILLRSIHFPAQFAYFSNTAIVCVRVKCSRVFFF